MSSGQNSSHLSDAEEQKRRKNRAVTKHRAAKKEEEEKRKTAIRQYKEDNMRLEASIQVMRAEGELLRSFVEAHEEASGGEFSRTPEGSQLIENISEILRSGERTEERREDGR